jgi:ribosome-binding protein aMBF1 (putative translation factor)
MRERMCDICGTNIEKQMPCHFEYHGYLGLVNMNVCVHCFTGFKSWVKEQRKNNERNATVGSLECN